MTLRRKSRATCRGCLAFFGDVFRERRATSAGCPTLSQEKYMPLYRQSSRTFVSFAIALAISLVALAQSRVVRKTVTKRQTPPVVAASPLPQPAVRIAQANLLPLRRAILYSNGVAYFERRGTVSARAEINLSFKQSQVDDVLKSLVV